MPLATAPELIENRIYDLDKATLGDKSSFATLRFGIISFFIVSLSSTVYFGIGSIN